ncbi:MAG: T9SS type A sorting domain-containing protein, partial [Lentimicrobium sp.]|nr:T9SS type A sorting domain-containing protein [Lentimicrobium sp.]
STGDVNFVTVVNIGTAVNAYSYGYAGGQRSILYSNNDINTVTHIHRMGGILDPGGYSGDLGIDISTDGGMTWSNQNEIYTSTISGGTYNTDAARYPNHGIWNPEGNTDPDNAFVTYFAPCIDGSNGADSWGGHAIGRARIGALTTDTTKTLTHSTPPFYQYLPDAYDVSKDGIIVAVDANQDWTTGTVAYQGSLIVYRGEWDEGIGDFVFERSLLDFPTNAENDRPTHVKFAFGPDGQTGWIGIVTDNTVVTPLTDLRYYYPVFIKTTDGGLTWGDPIAVRLDGPDGLTGVLNYLTDQQITDLYEPPAPARDEIPYTTAFDCDMAVDAWGNPHMAVMIGVGASSEYSIISAAEYFAAFDIFSTDGGTTWDGYCCGKGNQFRGTFGTDYSEDNRVQICSSQDGDKMFVTWLDTRLEGAEENNAPDVFARGIDINMPPIPWNYSVNESGEDMPVNVTTFSEAMWQAYFAVTSRFALDDGDGTYTIPISYQAMTTPFDPALPVQYKYIQDFSFTVGLDWIVGVDEKDNTEVPSVSQNYPNPFSQTSTIEVNLRNAGDLSLKVSNLLGQEVMTINKGMVPAGSYSFVIDGKDLKNGVYFYTVRTNNTEVTNKMIVR